MVGKDDSVGAKAILDQALNPLRDAAGRSSGHDTEIRSQIFMLGWGFAGHQNALRFSPQRNMATPATVWGAAALPHQRRARQAGTSVKPIVRSLSHGMGFLLRAAAAEGFNSTPTEKRA